MRTLDSFQHDVIGFANLRGRIVYADPMGARKTATTLAWLRQRESAQRICLVVPGGVIDHWRDEAKEWYPEAIVPTGKGAHGSKARREEALAAAAWNSDEGGSWPVIYITTYDAMKVDEKALAKAKFDTYVFDEGHRLKGRTTGVAKTAYRLTGKTTNILCVTGTPVLNHPEELWFYLHMLFRKTFTSFWSWAREHFIITLVHMGGGKTREDIGGYLPGHEEIVRRQIRTVFIQREDTELYPDAAWTAEPVFHPHYVTLTDDERRHYEKLVKHSWTQLPGRTVTAANRLAVNTRLRQIASDWGNLDAQLPAGAKVTEAALLVESLAPAGPVVVFTEYTVTAKRMQFALEKAGLRVGLYTGDEKHAQRELTKQWFITGQLDVIVGTYGTMKEGVDGLQKVSHQMVLVDLLWVYGLVMQAIGRLRRDGQTQPVHVYPIVALDTVDGTVLEANLTKKNVTQVLKGKPLADIIYGHSSDLILEDSR